MIGLAVAHRSLHLQFPCVGCGTESTPSLVYGLVVKDRGLNSIPPKFRRKDGNSASSTIPVGLKQTRAICMKMSLDWKMSEL